VFTNDAALPVYKGSTFRGVFGRALKSVVCALKQRECPDCLLAGRCLYAVVFEPQCDPGNGRKRIPSPPHPYVIEPPAEAKTNYTAGERFDFTLLLFGEANKNLPYFVYAIEQMGSLGIGRRVDGRAGTYVLQSVCSDRQCIYSGATRSLSQGEFAREIAPHELAHSDWHAGDKKKLGVRIVTPLRLKYQNRLEPELPFHVLIRTGLRRISALFERYDGSEPALDYRGLVHRAMNIRTVSSTIQWYDWRRYSNRQEQAMFLGGMTGAVVYEGDLAEFLPLLRLAEQVHLGKQTTFGLGRIELFDPDGGAA